MVRAVRCDEPSDYVVATGQAHSVEDLVREAFARVGIDEWRDFVEIDRSMLRPSDPRLLVGDAGKAREVLGWVPSVTFADMVGRMVDWDLDAASRGGGPGLAG
jgi:GDPmannose 4,6-dehydratase